MNKGIQYRFTISEFRNNNYIGVRHWIQDYEGDFIPTKNGFTMPYTLHTTSGLLKSLMAVLAKAEVLNEVLKHIKEEEDAD